MEKPLDISSFHNYEAQEVDLSSSNLKEFDPIIIIPNLVKSNFAYIFGVISDKGGQDVYYENLKYLGTALIPALKSIEHKQKTLEIKGLRKSKQMEMRKISCLRGNCNNQHQLKFHLKASKLNQAISIPIHKEEFNVNMSELFPTSSSGNHTNFRTLSLNDVIYPQALIMLPFNFREGISRSHSLWVDAKGNWLGWKDEKIENINTLKPQVLRDVLDEYWGLGTLDGREWELDKFLTMTFFTTENQMAVSLIKKAIPGSLLEHQVKTL